MDIFVSYTTKDHYIDLPLLKSVNETLSHFGNCYIDLLHNNAEDKQRHVATMLSQAELFILIESESVAKSGWVQWEISEAKKSRTPILILKASTDKNKTFRNLEFLLSDSHFLTEE